MAAIGARRVVEIGTLAGYSALWILRGLAADGRLWTIEANPEHAAAARRAFEEAGDGDRVEVIEGPGLDCLPTIEDNGPFDAVFIDADKRSYPAYGQWALDNVRPGGLILADNAYLFGYLAGREPDDRASIEDIEAMRRFHHLIAGACPRRACLPTPDGLLVGMVG